MTLPSPPDSPLLCLDAGNTSVHGAVLRGSERLASLRLARQAAESPVVLGAALRDMLRRCALSEPLAGAAVSVRPELNDCLRKAAEPLLSGPLHFVAHSDSPIEIRYRPPSSVGMDRLCNAVAVNARFQGRLPALAVDFGTATKFDLVAHDGAYEGGAIAPGLFSAFEGLVGAASLLKSIDLVAPDSPIGHSTAESLGSGFILGLAALTDGMVARFSAAAGSRLVCVATGGYAARITRYCSTPMPVDELLTLRGVQLLWEWRQRGASRSSS